MEVHDWSRLPPEVLVQIFRNFSSSDLVVNIPLVCRAWRDAQHHLVQQLSFWWERLEQEGIQITRDHREDLIGNVDKHKLAKLLKATSLPDIAFKQIPSHDYYIDSWCISSKLVSQASVYIMIRRPKHVNVYLQTNISESEDLDLLLLQLSHTNCSINFSDLHSYQFKSSSPADDILRHLNRENVKCKIKIFFGYLKSISSLPNSIRHLSLAIQCDEYGKAIDPGISTLRQNLLDKRALNFIVRLGTDISAIPSLYHNVIHKIDYE